ncbi:MAG: tudor domain-containing protein [Gemmatimonadaceae bacterium]
MRLSDDELRDVLARAEEIERSAPGSEVSAELEAVIGAAEEVGLSRKAVERALRERLHLPFSPPAVGSLVFARSANDKFYVAEVLSQSTDGTRVRFLSGSEHLVGPGELRPSAFLPGEQIMCEWPWWGPWLCTVISYNPASQRVEVSDRWGSTEVFPISEVWLAPRKTDAGLGARRRMYAKLIGTGLAVGAALGSLLTAFLMR